MFLEETMEILVKREENQFIIVIYKKITRNNFKLVTQRGFEPPTLRAEI